MGADEIDRLVLQRRVRIAALPAKRWIDPHRLGRITVGPRERQVQGAFGPSPRVGPRAGSG
jgi:hypothetical protein